MQFDEIEFNRLLVIGLENGESVMVKFGNFTVSAQTTNQSKKPVFFRYSMGARDWNNWVHSVPYDIKNFNQGIENYSNGMVLITEPGFRIDALKTLIGPNLETVVSQGTIK